MTPTLFLDIMLGRLDIDIPAENDRRYPSRAKESAVEAIAETVEKSAPDIGPGG